MRALIFPGQGSQKPGMALPWQQVESFGRWAQADQVLGMDVARLGADAPAEELTEPRNCQIALFVHHVVMLEAWVAARGYSTANEAGIGMTAGHSLGEYDALVAAGALGFEAALRLVDVRARATQAAAEQAPGTMIAALGFEVEQVEDACRSAGAHVANDNAVGQITISGTPAQLDAVKQDLSQYRGKVVDLPVGAAYHSPHMQTAVGPLGKALEDAPFVDADIPVMANVDASAHQAAGDWPQLLRDQVTSPVRWRQSVLAMRDAGVEDVVELGATSPLSAMIKRIDRSIGRTAITTPEEL